jgi:hypothetical protein
MSRVFGIAAEDTVEEIAVSDSALGIPRAQIQIQPVFQN